MQENDIPVTDDDRKAHEWADSPARQATEALAPIIRAIRAHVPVPALSDEWRDMLEKQDAGEVVSFSGLLARTVQMENDLAEARAEVEQIRKDADHMVENDLREARAEVERLTAVAEDYGRRATAALTERDEARAEVERLTTERDYLDNGLAAVIDRCNAEEKAKREAIQQRDDARAEVERLTASLNRQCTTVTPSVHNTDGLTVSNDTLPDPADVPEGEPWFVRDDWGLCIGSRRDVGFQSWTLVRVRTGSLRFRADPDVTLIRPVDISDINPEETA